MITDNIKKYIEVKSSNNPKKTSDEITIIDQELQNLVGIDEAGRGCVAGSLFVCGVRFVVGMANMEKIKDSKTLSKKSRALLASEIMQKQDYCLVKIKASSIDEIGISASMKLALGEIVRFFSTTGSRFLFDGNTNFGNEKISTMIKADNHNKTVAAASIVAKFSKDCENEEFSKIYKNYDFASHSGYLTIKHREELARFGAIDGVHRLTFRGVAPVVDQLF